jgi:putative sporulation protein YyaC
MNDFRNELRRVIPRSLDLSNVVFVCIGTDRSTGDSLGPYVGTLLTRLGYTNVIGTLDEPCHAENYLRLTEHIPIDKKLITVDASLGEHSRIGLIQARKGPFKPGAGVGKDLPKIGDYHMYGIVNVGGFMNYFVLQNTRLSLVINMAEQIVDAITHVFPLIDMSYVAAGRETG